MKPANQSIDTVPVNSAASKETCTQRHYSVAELAEAWKLSENTIRRMFEHEPGVLKWGTTESRYKRRYTTLRIPETVVLAFTVRSEPRVRPRRRVRLSAT